MILTVNGADFSKAYIGETNGYSVLVSGRGSSNTNWVDKGKDLTMSITINANYTYESLEITVGNNPLLNSDFTATHSNGTVSLTIPANLITGVVRIKVNATSTNTGGGTGTTPPVTPEQPGTGGENGIYPIGQVLDSGTVSINATTLHPACATKGILECGGTYEITITPSYSGNCTLYLCGSTGSQYVLKQQTGVVANTPFTLTFNVPYLNYLGKEKVELNKVWFRSHQSTECTFTYSIKKTGYNNNPLEGVAIFKDSTISATGQRVYGFEAGCTYDYEITPSYTGTMTIYQAYSDAGVSPGSVENIGAMSIASVTANTPITGTITILETPSVTESTLGRLPDTLILRSHQSVEVSIQYKFTKK